MGERVRTRSSSCAAGPARFDRGLESAVILEYLEETQAQSLHPADPLQRALHRSWIEFGSQVLNGIARFYNARTDDAPDDGAKALASMFVRLEAELFVFALPGGIHDGRVRLNEKHPSPCTRDMAAASLLRTRGGA